MNNGNTTILENTCQRARARTCYVKKPATIFTQSYFFTHYFENFLLIFDNYYAIDKVV